jgi:hypothetical protein
MLLEPSKLFSTVVAGTWGKWLPSNRLLTEFKQGLLETREQLPVHL